jgi:teichuronic acid biosynthesis glycosyltransferase TuaC
MSAVVNAVGAPTFGVGPKADPRLLRVLTLTPFYPSQENQAQGCFVAEPLHELKTNNVTSEVVAVRPFYRGRAGAMQSEISCRWHSYLSLPGNVGLPLAGETLSSSLMLQVRSMHRQQPFDLIHAHSALPCGHAAMLLSRRLGIPFVVTVHGLDAFSTEQAGAGIGPWCRRISKQVYESAEVVICISEKVRRQVTEFAQARTAVVHNGVNVSQFYPGEATAPLTVLSVGNLIPIKGHALLLHAFARLAGDGADCQLEIIGEGPERAALAKLANDHGISERVQFLGRRSREEVAVAMRRCAVFALPSRYEGLGCVYLEAMASGKPAIGCRAQGIDEIIDHEKDGLLIAPGDAGDLYNWLAMLLSNEQLRRRIGHAAREKVLSRHTLAHQAGELAELYRECAP